MGDSVKSASFRDANERDQLRWSIDMLVSAAGELAKLRTDPTLKPYLLTEATSEMPVFPAAPDTADACAVLEQVAACLRHRYELLRRNDSDLERQHKPSDLDDERLL